MLIRLENYDKTYFNVSWLYRASKKKMMLPIDFSAQFYRSVSSLYHSWNKIIILHCCGIC